MKLEKLASKPQLIKLVIDDAEIIEEFGEPLEFWTWDRQPIDIFMKLAIVSNKDTSSMIEIMRTLILSEEGKEIIGADAMLPSNILLKVISRIVELLGK
jgi:hypothetical protein